MTPERTVAKYYNKVNAYVYRNAFEVGWAYRNDPPLRKVPHGVSFRVYHWQLKNDAITLNLMAQWNEGVNLGKVSVLLLGGKEGLPLIVDRLLTCFPFLFRPRIGGIEDITRYGSLSSFQKQYPQVLQE